MVLHESGLEFNLISVDGESSVTNLFSNLNLAQLKGISPPRDFFCFFSSWCDSFVARICLQSFSENGKWNNDFSLAAIGVGCDWGIRVLLWILFYVVLLVTWVHTIYICNYMGCMMYGAIISVFQDMKHSIAKNFSNHHPRCKWAYLSIHIEHCYATMWQQPF